MPGQPLQLLQEQTRLRLPPEINPGNMEIFARAAREILDATKFDGKVAVTVTVSKKSRVTAALAGVDQASLLAAKRLLTARVRIHGQSKPSLIEHIASALKPDAKGHVLPAEALETIIGSARYAAEIRAPRLAIGSLSK